MVRNNQITILKKKLQKSKNIIIPIFLLMTVSFLFGVLTQQKFGSEKKVNVAKEKESSLDNIDLEKLQSQVLPQNGYVFNIKWGDLGKKMIEDGVIDELKLAQALTGEDKIPENFKKYLDGTEKEKIELSQENAHFWVDILWGLGLANKSKILDEGQMMEGGDASKFASTGGWTIGQKEPMELYSKFSYIKLDAKQEETVKEIAENVFRPCCGNSTAFPDCNHGMAALGLIELMVSQGFSKDEIYKTVLAFNAYWFPQTYLDISYHYAKNGREYKDISPKELLSKTFSSAMGYQALKKQVGDIKWPLLQQSGGGCGA